MRRVRPNEVRQKQSGGLFLVPRAGGVATAAPGESRHFDTLNPLKRSSFKGFALFVGKFQMRKIFRNLGKSVSILYNVLYTVLYAILYKHKTAPFGAAEG